MISEQAIQSKIKKKLQEQGYLVVKLIKTSLNGIPDLLALKDGKALFIEVKKEKGTLSELQKDVINELKEKGFEAVVWADFETEFQYRTKRKESTCGEWIL